MKNKKKKAPKKAASIPKRGARSPTFYFGKLKRVQIKESFLYSSLILAY